MKIDSGVVPASATGEPAIYNGLYSTCINGDYYRRHALTILTEALERYEVDGLFFNMFGNRPPTTAAWRWGVRVRRVPRPLPRRTAATCRTQADADYRAFMADSAREVA